MSLFVTVNLICLASNAPCSLNADQLNQATARKNVCQLSDGPAMLPS